MELTNPINRVRGDHCVQCNKDRVIECYDCYERPLNYTLFLDRYENDNSIINVLNNKVLKYMKCRNCGQVYLIDWRTKFPIPLYSLYATDVFLYYYSKQSSIIYHNDK